MRGHEILNNPFLNKGTAFTMEERKELGLLGILPPYVQTIEEQAEQAYQHFLRKPSNLEKRHFLMEIFNTNRTLFYYLFKSIVGLTQCTIQLSLKQSKGQWCTLTQCYTRY